MQNLKTSVSVVIPAKNRASTLSECIDSVLTQSFQVNEVIVIDDHSSDDTKNLVCSYVDPRVKYFALPLDSFGAQSARNYGIQIASSDWIAFQDSDDVWVKDKLKQQLTLLEPSNFDEMLVVHGDCIRQNVDSGIEVLIEPPLMDGDCYKDLLIRPSPFFPAILASKRALNLIGGLDKNCPAYQEWDTSIRLSRICKFIHIRAPLFLWKVHKIDSISKNQTKDIQGFNYVIESHKNEIVLLHGIRVWQKLKLKNSVRALKFGLWNDAKTTLAGLDRMPLAILIKFFALIRIYPKGLSRLIW